MSLKMKTLTTKLHRKNNRKQHKTEENNFLVKSQNISKRYRQQHPKKTLNTLGIKMLIK